jgi:serine/threonine protein kinase
MSELKLLQCRLDARYDIQECLGRGSYAEIYLARDTAATDERFREVVIKALNVLLQGYQDVDLEQTLIQNFQNEAVALDRVRHPNIISRLGHGTALDLNGTAFHYIVLEYLSGGDLAKLCRSEALTLERALHYLQQVCAGLAHAHACDVIHRDIKPQNLLLTADKQTVKIADFGVARIEASEGAITRVGTNIYAAPEHNPLVQTAQLDTASLKPSLTPAADIYSLAKTAYTMICGVSPRAFAHQPITELPAPISFRPWASSLLRVLERATQTRPAERYQTVREFWEDLNDVAMPVMQPLAGARPQQHRISADLSVDEPVTAVAPPKPRFETSRELKQQQAAGDAAVRPRIVVPIHGTQPYPLAAELASLESGRGTLPTARNGSPERSPASIVVARSQRRGRNFVVGMALVLCFAGLLVATGAYVRSLLRHRTQPPITSGPDAGRQAITTTDVNLRAGPNRQTDIVGLAESGSRVQVLTMPPNSSWCEVQVLQHARPKDDPSSQDRGWVNRTYLRFD